VENISGGKIQPKDETEDNALDVCGAEFKF